MYPSKAEDEKYSVGFTEWLCYSVAIQLIEKKQII